MKQTGKAKTKKETQSNILIHVWELDVYLSRKTPSITHY